MGVQKHVANVRKKNMIMPRFYNMPTSQRVSAMVKFVGADISENVTVSGGLYEHVRIVNGISQATTDGTAIRSGDRILNLTFQCSVTLTNWGTSTTGSSFQDIGSSTVKNFAADWNEIGIALVYSSIPYAASPLAWSTVFSKPGTITFRNAGNMDNVRVLWARRLLFTGASTRYSIVGHDAAATVFPAGALGPSTKEFDETISINLSTVFKPDTPVSSTQLEIENGSIFWMFSGIQNFHIAATFRHLFIDQNDLMPSRFPPARF